MVNHLGTRLRVVITREEFERTTAALLGRTRTTTQIVLQQSGFEWGEIDRVLLVGGSTRMPMVAGMIEELSGRPPDLSLSADEAVAHGAAIYADLVARERGLIGGTSNFTVTDVNSHSLGVAGIDRRTGRPVNRVMIPKNTPLPHAASGRFKTAKAGQRSVRIRVLEGESEQPDACTEVGTCVIRDLPADLPSGSPVEVRYAYDASGRLRVTARLSGHDAAVTTEFIRDGSLSEGDLLLWGERLAEEASRLEW
jgi:molecular chaperone DnaK